MIVEEKANCLPEVVRSAFADAAVTDSQGTRVKLSSNVSEAECRILYDAVRACRPETSIEIGFAQGISATSILQALEDNGAGHHHVVDPYQGFYHDCGLVTVQRAGLSHRMTFHRAFAEDVTPGLGPIQFAFIDSSHLFDLTVSEFVLIDKRLAVGGLVGFHDMWMPSQQAVLRYILANRSYVVDEQTRGKTAFHMPGWKRWLRAVARRLPRSERVFAQEFLKPWHEMDIPNLVLLRKTAEDAREWTDHSRF